MSANERTIPSTLPPPKMEVDSSELETGKLESTRGKPAIKQEENRGKSGWKGRIAGGSFLKHLHDTDSETDDGPLKEVEIDMPLTLTEITYPDDQEYIILRLVEGDKENPFNWSKDRKSFISLSLCLMTLFTGLATAAYSSGIDRMCADLGVSTELGQLGLFCFNMACALALLFLAPFCELVGRRVIYAGAYVCFVLVFIG